MLSKLKSMLKSMLCQEYTNSAKLKKTLQAGHQVALILLDIMQFTKYKQLYGIKTCSQILKICTDRILSCTNIYPANTLVELNPSGDEFSLYVIYHHQDVQLLTQWINQLCDHLSAAVLTNFPQVEPLRFHKGYSLIEFSPAGTSEESFNSTLYNAHKKAYNMLKTPFGMEQAAYYGDFLHIINAKTITTMFQPIVSLQNASILGWEALTRGPKDHYFYSPDKLFSFAETTGFLYQLEKIARESALASIASQGLPANNKVFINTNPDIINDPDFISGQTRMLLNSLNISPANIIIELTERTSIENFQTFKKTLEHYRRQGYLIAIDDAGAGYSSLQSIAELKPDYIKIDLSLVRNIHNAPIKQTLLETFVAFSQKINAYLIAEGIEDEEELNTLIKLGVNYGQGFLLAKPNNVLEPLAGKVVEHIIAAQQNKEEQLYSLNIPISYLCVDTKCYVPQITLGEVADYFHNNPDTNGVVILKDQTPIGLVMRERLNSVLASHYGKSLYLNKPVSHIMQANPLMIDSNTPLDVAAQLAMQRNYTQANDYLIITHDHKYLGIVSINSIMLQLSKLNEKKVALAYAANPLSGLPGNLTIQQRLEQRLKSGEQIAVIYADLDKFKAYNDLYGFENGDQVIRFTASVICQAAAQYPSEDNFVGHIGGDDFLIITKPELAAPICQKIIQLFDQEIISFYDNESASTNANMHSTSIMTISLAIVETQPCQFISYLELAKIAAQLKSLAKKQPVSNYIKNRRLN
jgi:diguanylate cyclase (GGDEF)-like protein